MEQNKEEKIFVEIFFVIPPIRFENFDKNHRGGYYKNNLPKKFFSYFIPYIKMDKNSILEYHIKKFLTHLNKSRYWFKIVTLSPL